MSYQVIARKWRPKTFEEVVGQSHIVQTLTNAITSERVAHAYLFAGTRGVGKTSTARIFSRALNCINGPCVTPCNECELCREILDARSLDVIEIDGASNTSVDDVRELRESVKYAPAKTNYKIYIIDEVHMLSKSAFNALLKTLEEPPAHLIFIFATTELNKIPDTILSRCQYFEFKQINSEDMVKQLDFIAKNEEITISKNSLKCISRAAEGSMRDAESLMDQIISFAGKDVSEEQIASILGMAGQELLTNFVDKIIGRDTGEVLELYQDVVKKGQDTKLFCRELQGYFRNLAIAKVSKDPQQLMDIQEEDITTLKAQAGKIGVEEIQYLFNTLMKIEYDLKNSAFPTMVLEMALIRMCRYQPVELLEDILKKLSTLEMGKPLDNTPATRAPISAPRPSPVPAAAPVPAPTPAPAKQEAHMERPNLVEAGRSMEGPQAVTRPEGNEWERIFSAMVAKKSSFGFLMSNCRMLHLDDEVLRIGVADKMSLERLNGFENLKVIDEAVLETLGSKRKIELESVKQGLQKPNVPNTPAAPVKEDQPPPQAQERPQASPNPEAQPSPDIIQEAVEIFGGMIVR